MINLCYLSFDTANILPKNDIWKYLNKNFRILTFFNNKIMNT